MSGSNSIQTEVTFIIAFSANWRILRQYCLPLAPAAGNNKFALSGNSLRLVYSGFSKHFSDWFV